MTTLLHELQDENSDIMSLKSIGKTWEGRNVWMVKFSDNVLMDENEPEILFDGAIHGNEKIAYEVLIYFIQYVCENYRKSNTDDDKDGNINEDIIDGKDNDNDGLIDEDPSEERVHWAVDNTEMYIIPMVNPDGVEANTRKNCAPNYGPLGNWSTRTSIGVDLNRNFGYEWNLFFDQPLGYYFPYTTQYLAFTNCYRGEAPFCENETIALRDFSNHRDFMFSIAYHDFGEWVLYPWGYTKETPPDEELLISVATNISGINNYVPIQSSNLYRVPALGGEIDWLYGEKGTFAFLIELCETRAPTDTEIVLKTCKTHVGVHLYICELTSK